MKKSFFILAALFATTLIYSENVVPKASIGESVKHHFNKNGSKHFEIKFLDISFTDSTENGCYAHYKIQLKAVGQKVDFEDAALVPFIGVCPRYGLHHHKSDDKDFDAMPTLYKGTLIAGDSTIIQLKYYIRAGQTAPEYISYNKKPIVELAYLYDVQEYETKKQAALLAQQKAREERETERKRIQEEQEKTARAERSRCDTLLTIPYLANWVGASFFTKDNIERDLNIDPVGYSGGLVLYNFPKCGVSMEFSGAEEVCTELSFRLYGEEGMQMKKDLLEYGYALVEKKKDLIAENNFRDMQYGTHSVYKCKLKNGGYSVCELLEGQAFMFTFYRSAR